MVQVLSSPNAPHRLIDAGGDGWHIQALGATGSTDGSSATADTAALVGGLGSSAKLANGGLLKLDAGTYWLNSQLNIPSGIVMRGQSKLGSVLKANAAMAALINIPNNVVKFVARDMTFDGNGGLANFAIQIGTGTQEMRFERCHFQGGLLALVSQGTGGAKVVFEDCSSQDVGIAAISVVYNGANAQCVGTFSGSGFSTKIYDSSGVEQTADEIPVGSPLTYATYPTVTALAAAITAFGGGSLYTATVLNAQGAASSNTLSRVSANCKTAFTWWVGRRDFLFQGPAKMVRHSFQRTNTNPCPMVDMQSSRVDVVDSDFDGNGVTSTAVYLSGNSVRRNKVVRNHFENVATGGVQGSVVFCDGTSGTGQRPNGIKIDQNTFYNCNQFGGAFDGVTGVFSGGSTVGGCISFGDCDLSATGRIGKGLHIGGNQAEGCGQFIFVGPYWQGVTVEHNIGHDLAPGSSVYPGQNAQGIEIHAQSGSVANNSCDNCGPVAIWVGSNKTGYRNRISCTGNAINATTRAILDAAGLTTVKPYGMVISGPDVTIGDNIITGDKSAGSAAILLQSGAHQDTTQITIASGNKLRSWDYAITYAQTGGFVVGFQVMGGNEFADLLTGPMPARTLTDVASVVAQNGVGLTTRASGTATIASGTTSIQISHGLTSLNSLSPGDRIRVAVSATNNPTNDPGHLWVSAIDEVHATLNCRADPGASGLNLVYEAWRAL